jgi:hypothetical protein
VTEENRSGWIHTNASFRVVTLSNDIINLNFTNQQAQPSTNFGVSDAQGNQNTFVLVPVNITNAQNGPIAGILFGISFNSSIINLTSARVTRGGLTSAWFAPSFNPNTGLIQISYTGSGTEIPNGASGSVVVLNFSVIGSLGTTSNINISGIQLSDPDGNLGTAPAKNGIFTVTSTPTPTNFGLNDSQGNQNTFVLVPVNITNAQTGPIAGILFDISFNSSVINLTSARVTRGGLTSAWDAPSFNPVNGRISIVGVGGSEIPNGANGSVVILNFSVIGSPGAKSNINISRIQLSDTNGNLGTAPAKNGTFTVTLPPVPTNGTIVGNIAYSNNGTWIPGVTVNLTNAGGVIASTTTNASGGYNFTNVIPGSYNVNTSKPMFFGNSTGGVVVTAGSANTVNRILWMKGDLNNNGMSADAGDLVLMKRASVGEILADFRYELNNNGILADAGDLVLIKRASVGEIILS